ncbi:unnamed protein product [Schistosoma rodhaini]|uniref:Uncharacterized protein n=1 Tax=Schistosoma rodhaini TaxID=6188 RepID=A0AA85GFV9_9TREM|nr:unnamed protein product [Schistosoma rodhaini]
MFADLYNSSWMYNSRSKVTTVLNGSNISALSEYTKRVFLILGIEIAITLLIIIILSVLETVQNTQNPWTDLPWILICFAFVLGMLIIFDKAITNNYPLSVGLLIIHSILIGFAIGISIWKVCVYLKIAAIAITLISFICSIFIGGAVKTRLADHFLFILINIVIVSIAFVAAGTVFYVLERQAALVALEVGADIILFLITICATQFTVGKYPLRVFPPYWTLAALIMYALFYANLSNNLYLAETIQKVTQNKTYLKFHCL